MRILVHITVLVGTLLAGPAAVAVDGDDIDRIVAAVGVDSMHSVDEEPRMRRALSEAFAEMKLKRQTVNVPEPNTPEFETVVRQAVDGQQRMRRDPLVFAAYRNTLTAMLSPEELTQAAAFYSTPVGRRAHIAVVEAEKAAALAMEEVATRQDK